MLSDFTEVKSYWRGQELNGEKGNVSQCSTSHGVYLHMGAL